MIESYICVLLLFVIGVASQENNVPSDNSAIINSRPFSGGQRAIFWKDYTYVEEFQSFYKFHSEIQTWEDARRTCEAEAATLFYPETDKEASILDWTKKTTPQNYYLYIGVSDIKEEGQFETVDGKPIENVYHKWAEEEPNNKGNEDCVIMRQDLTLNDIDCSDRTVFICKRNLATIQWNKQCNSGGKIIPYWKDYTYVPNTQSFYKFHSDIKTWQEAKQTCEFESATLFYPENADEAPVLDWRKKTTPQNYYLYIGVTDMKEEGKFETVDGIPIDYVYNKWAESEPNNLGEEDCVIMRPDLTLNDFPCSDRTVFICKRNLVTLASTQWNLNCNEDDTASGNALIFDEEFEISNLSELRNWDAEVKFVGEPDYPFNMYAVDGTVSFEEGSLVIKPVLTESQYHEGILYESLDLAERCTGHPGTSECSVSAFGAQILPPVMTAKITTKHKFSSLQVWQSGEINLEPTDSIYGRKNYESGLMRIAFARGNPNQARKLFGGPVLASSEPFRSFLLKEKIGTMNWDRDYHVYTLMWRPDGIDLFMDGEQYGSINPGEGFYAAGKSYDVAHASHWQKGTVMAPLDQPFHITLGLRVGGVNDFPDNLPDKPWRNAGYKAMLNFWQHKYSWFPSWENSAMKIDYVRVYSL